MKVNVDKDVITSKTRVKVLIYTPRKCFNLGRILLSEVIFYRNLYLRCFAEKIFKKNVVI